MRAFFFCACAAALMFAGCGDDSGAPADSGTLRLDTGVRDSGGRDAGRRDAGPRADTGPDDAGPTGTLRECDPLAPDCAADEKCAVVLDGNDDENTFIYFGCVPLSTGNKGQGVLCASLNEDATPDDTADDVLTDECAEGLFCWLSGAGATTTRCHPLCLGADPTECGADQYCDGLNDEPFFGICSDADNCNPIHQTGCPTERACYYILNGMERLLGSCFPFVPEMDGGVGAPGEPCTFINNCAPGSQCLPDRLPDGGLAMERFCRELCSRGATDGGMPTTDAGPMGGCTGTEMCDEYPIPGTFAGEEIAGFCN